MEGRLRKKEGKKRKKRLTIGQDKEYAVLETPFFGVRVTSHFFTLQIHIWGALHLPI
jgi:hypothetical protein